MRTIKRFIYESLLKEALKDFTTELNGDQKECHMLENSDPIVLELNEIIKNLKSKNKISLDSITKIIQMDDSVWYSAKIYGGVNGNGLWQSYLEDYDYTDEETIITDREQLEKETGKKIISDKNAQKIRRLNGN